MNATIFIVLKSFQTAKLGNYNKIKKSAPQIRNGSSVFFQFSCLRLPKTRTLFTVLRSPHIDKKSREQYEMKIHKQLIKINSETKYLHKQLQRLILHDIPGVQFKIIINFKTRLSLNYC